jgi:hypothetical protein
MSSTLSMLRDRLLETRNADHGWGYLPGRISRIEPTAWAVLALAEDAPQSRNALVAWRRHGGLVTDTSENHLNYAYNALAAIALAASQDTLPIGFAVVRALMEVGGVTWSRRASSGLDPSLRGWAWYPDTFSWVEPTALCAIAAKRVRHLGFGAGADPRIAEAERLLLDRVCAEGGWNYGNSIVFGQRLRADVPTTAIALIAMQDRMREAPVMASLRWLERHAVLEPSTMGLGLATIALSILDAAAHRPLFELEALVRRDGENTNLAGLAIAAYALGWERHGFEAFRF